MNHVRPYDVPYNLRASMDKELSDTIDAGVLSPSNEARAWTHQLFPVPKHINDEIRLVSDFRRLNAALVRPVYLVESNTQLMRHLEPTARWFATLDMVSGYHQLVTDIS